MFALKIIVVINALRFSAAICLGASHNGFFPSVFPQAGRRREAQTEAAAWAFPSTSVSAGRDSPDGDREKGGLSGV